MSHAFLLALPPLVGVYIFDGRRVLTRVYGSEMLPGNGFLTWRAS